MAQVITFIPRSSSPSGLLRAARERSGLDHAQFAAHLGRAIGRIQLTAGTVRAWEGNSIPPPIEVLEAAQRLAADGPPRPSGAVNRTLVPAPTLLVAALPEADADRPCVEVVLQAFRDADRQHGGGCVYGAVVRYLEREIAPRLFKGTSDVFCAAAALTEMAGWMAHDAGSDALAREHFDRALRFALATDDVELTAHVHASLSHLVQQLNSPREGLRLAQAGRSVLRRRNHHPALSARLYAMEAQALATLRRRADCERALTSAQRTLDRAPSRSPSPWVSPFDRASLAAEASQCLQQLQQLVAARSHSEQVIHLRNTDQARSRAFGQLRLAAILVAQGEIEHACSMSQAALASSDRLSSSRVTQLVQSLHAQLLPHAPARGVEDVLRSLCAALSTRTNPRVLMSAVRGLET